MSLEIGGAETHILELCKALQKKGLQVYVASNGGAYEQELVDSGAIHYKVPLHNKQIFNMVGAYRALKRIITEHDIRLVHAHARIPAFLCSFLQRKLNFRFVTTAHWVFKTKFPYNFLSNWGEKSLPVSADIKDYLIQHYRVPENDIYITVNGVDTEKFSPNAKPTEAAIDGNFQNESPRIMTLSRQDKDRSLNSHLLIEAAPSLQERYPNFAIYIVGDGDDYKNIRAKADSMNTRLGREAIKLPGATSNPSGWMVIADVFVNSSRSVLEAMSVGVPVVNSGNEGYLGLISEENLPIAVQTNFCYRGCGDATLEKMTADIFTILDMPENERATMGNLGREFVKQYYSVERMADDAIELYRTVLASPSPVRVRKTDILISGYYGYNNSGDDLLLKAIVKDLRARREDLIITVLSKRPRQTRAEYGVNSIYRFNFFAIWRLLRRSRLLLTGGGTHIQDLTSTRSLIYYLWIIRTAQRLGVKNMLYANGIGPINNPANIRRVQRVLEEVDLITLREDTAKVLLQNLNISKPEIAVTADPAFSLPPPDYDLARKELKALGIKENNFLCVSLRDWKYNPAGFEMNIARFCDYVSEKYELAILFVMMRPSEDTEISKKTISYMKKPAIIMESTQNIDSMRGIVGLSALTLSMRLHGLIYAINQGIPVIGLVYDPKVEWLMKSVNQDFYTTVEDSSADKLIGFADSIYGDFEAVSENVRKAGEIAKSLAELNAELCIELIELSNL